MKTYQNSSRNPSFWLQVEPCGGSVCDGLGPVDCLWDPWGDWCAKTPRLRQLFSAKVQRKETSREV